MKRSESLTTTEDQTKHFPALVEADKMFEKLWATTNDIATRAYEIFIDGGRRFGSEIEDWLRAETEMLRAAPAKITENKDHINATIAVPGYKPKEIEMSIKDKTLIVSGETTAHEDRDDDKIVYSEWRSDRFLRQLELPCEVETNGLEAVVDNGVLKLALKKKAATEATKVAVKAA
jgi:HSP20 family protein